MPSAPGQRNLRLLYAFWFLREFQLWIPVWMVLLTINRGFTFTQITSAEALFLVGVVLLEVPTGAVADRWGRSRSLALGALCLGIAILVFASTTTFALLLISFLLWSVSQTLMSGADMALLFDTLRRDGQESRYEQLAGRGEALTWAGAGVATLLGGPVAALTSIETTVYIGAATCVLGVIAALAMWEPPRHVGHDAEPYLRSIPAAFREVIRSRTVRLVILLSGATFAAMESVWYLIQPYLLDRDLEVGLLFSLLQVPLLAAGIGGALLAARMEMKAGAVRLFAGVPIIGAVMFGLLAALPGFTGYAALPILLLLSASLRPIATGFINRRVSSAHRATVLSIHGMAVSVVMAGIAPAIGWLLDNRSVSVAFTFAGLIVLLITALFAPALLRSPQTAPRTLETETIEA